MNVHVSQLKLLNNDTSSEYQVARKRIVKAVTEPSKTKTSVVQDHYLADFEEDELNLPIVENQIVEANVAGDRMVDAPADVTADEQLNVPDRGVRIDNAWVEVDVSNIVPGRTRGARQNYQQIASGVG